jgi:hypothetical protein
MCGEKSLLCVDVKEENSCTHHLHTFPLSSDARGGGGGGGGGHRDYSSLGTA